MRLFQVVSLLAGALALPTAACAQQVKSFHDLPLRIDRGDQIRVADQLGAKISGRVVSFGRDGLTLQNDGGVQTFSEAAVRRVDRAGSSKARGALIGAGVFALVGAAVCDSSASVGAACPLVFGLAFGGPLGALAGAWTPSMRVVFRASSAPAGARADTSRDAKASFMEDLGMAVNLGDRVSVETVSGETSTGILSWLGDDGFGIAVGGDAQPKDYTRETVRRVSVMRGHAKVGTLVGFVAFSALCLPDAGSEWPDALALCGGPGAGIGALVGGLSVKRRVVYPTRAVRLSVGPAMVHHRVGVRAVYRF